jgi:hypothetical protein
LATDDDGVPILCLVVKEYQRLSAFRLPRKDLLEEIRTANEAGLKLAWSLEAISAAPIIAFHPRFQFDLRVLFSQASSPFGSAQYLRPSLKAESVL